MTTLKNNFTCAQENEEIFVYKVPVFWFPSGIQAYRHRTNVFLNGNSLKHSHIVSIVYDYYYFHLLSATAIIKKKIQTASLNNNIKK